MVVKDMLAVVLGCRWNLTGFVVIVVGSVGAEGGVAPASGVGGLLPVVFPVVCSVVCSAVCSVVFPVVFFDLVVVGFGGVPMMIGAVSDFDRVVAAVVVARVVHAALMR